MKKKAIKAGLWILSGIFTLVIFIIGYRLYEEKNMPVVSIDETLEYRLFHSEEELYQHADLIILGHNESEPKKAEVYEDLLAYAVHPIKIDRVLKGEIDTDTITYISPAMVRKNSKGQSYIFSYANCPMLEQEKEYILYLGKSTETYQEMYGGNVYGPVSFYHGIYSLDPEEVDERVQTIAKNVYRRFEKEIQKYKKD